MTPHPAAAGTPSDTTPADLVAAAALGVPGVVSLHAGPLGDVAAYLGYRRVVGVRLRPDRTAVHVVLSLDSPLRATVEAVRSAVVAVRPGPVDVTVEDVVEARRGAA